MFVYKNEIKQLSTSSTDVFTANQHEHGNMGPVFIHIHKINLQKKNNLKTKTTHADKTSQSVNHQFVHFSTV